MTACEGEVVLLAFIERGDGCGQGYDVGLTCGIGEGEEGALGVDVAGSTMACMVRSSAE